MRAPKPQNKQADEWQPEPTTNKYVPKKVSSKERDPAREHTVEDYSKWEGLDSAVEESDSEEERRQEEEKKKDLNLNRQKGDVVKIVDDEGDVGVGRINGPIKEGAYPVIAHGLPNKILWLPPDKLVDPPKKRTFYCRPCCFSSKEKVKAEILCPEGCKAYYCAKCDDKVHRRFPKSLHMRERLTAAPLVDKWKPPKRKIAVEAKLCQNGKKEKPGPSWMEFFWGQTDESLYISVPLPPRTRSKTVCVQLVPPEGGRKTPQLIISLMGENDDMKELMDGSLAYDVEPEEFPDIDHTFSDWEVQDFEKPRNPDVCDPFENPWPESKWAGHRVAVVTLTKKKKVVGEKAPGMPEKGETVWFERCFVDSPVIDSSLIDKKMTNYKFWEGETKETL